MHESIQTQPHSQPGDPDQQQPQGTEIQDGVPDNAIWWQNPLVREIGLILAVKLVLIFALWWFFFDLPDNQRINSSQVGTHLIGTTPATILTPEEDAK